MVVILTILCFSNKLFVLNILGNSLIYKIKIKVGTSIANERYKVKINVFMRDEYFIIF